MGTLVWFCSTTTTTTTAANNNNNNNKSNFFGMWIRIKGRDSSRYGRIFIDGNRSYNEIIRRPQSCVFCGSADSYYTLFCNNMVPITNREGMCPSRFIIELSW
jgi:hypothetical protein